MASSEATAPVPGGAPRRLGTRDADREADELHARRASRVLPRTASWQPLPVGTLAAGADPAAATSRATSDRPAVRHRSLNDLTITDLPDTASNPGRTSVVGAVMAEASVAGAAAAAAMSAAASEMAAARRTRRLRPADLDGFAGRDGHEGQDAPTVDRRSQSARDAEREAEFARTIELIDRDWQMRVDMARADGIREGVRLAAEQHAARMAEEAQQLARRGHALLTALDTELQGLQADVASRLMDIAIHFGARIACREMAVDRQRLAPVLAQIVSLVDDDFRAIELTVHPDDLDVARDWIEQRSAGRTVTLRPDPALIAGGCVARIDDHCIDGRIGTRVAHALEAMGWTADEARRDTAIVTQEPVASMSADEPPSPHMPGDTR